MRGRPWLLAWIAVTIGVMAFMLVWRIAPTTAPRSSGAADDYCYELKQGWVCMYQRADCETRLASEPAASVKKACEARYDEVLTP